jgi:RNA polymerase sigma-70 factor (ECF subfamily)
MTDLKKLTDAELVSLYQNQNDRAFKVLLNRYKSKVYSVVYYIVKDRDLADDITQDVFCKFIDTIHKGKYNENGKFQQWIMRVAHNLAVDHYRKNKKYQMVREDEDFSLFNTLPLGTASVELTIIQKETKQLLREQIKKLPFEQRQVLIMRHFADMSFQEISDFTGVSINTALGRMRYALINLRKMLTPIYENEKKYYPT